MSTNTELATIFEEMADILLLLDANVFRVNAHARVARELRDLTTDVATLADDPARLTAIDGIGKGSAEKIIEYITTGSVQEHQKLRSEIPVGLLELLRIPGIGPKTVKLMWEHGDVTDLATLKAKLETGELAKLPRMGQKTLANIRDSIAFTSKLTGRLRLGSALPIAERFVETLSQLPGTRQIAYAGSLRRGKETIGDIDIVATADDPAKLSHAFETMEGVTKVLASGQTKSSVRYIDKVQVDLRIVPDDALGAAMLYFTGSKQHNVRLRERAIKAKMRLNEYGLFPDDGEDAPPQQRGIKPVAAKTEHDIYRTLGINWIPPELREDRGEFDADLPKLIELTDIKAELHAHTIASDGRLTIDELAMEAKQRGFHTIAVTDHSKSSPLAGGLSEDRLRAHIDAIHEANDRSDGITILVGSEVDILATGKLDYDDELLAQLDIVVASPHGALTQDSATATKRLLAAIKHPLVHIIGHPTGRMINKREGLRPKMDKLIEAAAEHDTVLEINANPARLDLRDSHVKAAVDAGALIAVNTDAHTAGDFDLLRYGILTARRGWLTKECCINTWSRTKLHKWLKAKR